LLVCNVTRTQPLLVFPPEGMQYRLASGTTSGVIEKTHKVLATVKIVGLSSILVGVGAILYYATARRNKNNQTGV
jgi:hypothetical protein